MLHIGMKLKDRHPTPDWWMQLFADDWTLYAGVKWSLHKPYKGWSLVPSRARVKWNAIQGRMLGFARALVVFGHLLEEVQLRPGGSKYRRVKARFDMMTAAPSV